MNMKPNNILSNDVAFILAAVRNDKDAALACI